MPLLTLRTNVSLDSDKATSLLKVCSAELASQLGKPEHYVLTMYQPAEAMTMSGTTDPACLIEVRSVGSISPDQARSMSAAFGRLVEEHIGVPTDRTYLQFEGVDGALWGYDGRTFR